MPSIRSVLALAAVVLLSLGPGVGPASAEDSSSGSSGPAPHPATAFHPQPGDDARLVAAWHTWRDQHVRDYQTTVTRGCFCVRHPDTVTQVRGRTVTSVTYQGQAKQRRGGYDVGSLFAFLRDAYAHDDSVRVRYGPDGVPRRISTDPSRLAADDEQYLTIRIGPAAAAGSVHTVSR